jgi:hypothetical protein
MKLLLIALALTLKFVDAWRSGPLFAVVTGREHSGTTVVSSLIKNAPGVFGGFECGFLLAQSPADYGTAACRACRPFDAWLGTNVNRMHMWNVSAEGLGHIRGARDFEDMYARLARESPTLRAIPGVRVLDKTPRYFYALGGVLDKVPGVPCIVTVKDPHDPFREGGPLHGARRHAARINVVHYRNLTADPHGTMRRIFDFLGLEWDPSYLHMRGFVQQLALSHGESRAEEIASHFAFKRNGHTPGSKGHSVTA